MDGALVYSPLRNADPLFREEKAFLTASSVVCGVELKWLDFLEAESYLETRFKKIDFLYFYDEDLYLEDLAVRLGIPTFNTPDNYLPAHDLGAFYKRMKENDLPCPAFYASPNLGKYPLSRNFESLSVSLKDAGVFYPFCLRRKEEVAVYKPSLCLTPIEFNGELMELVSTPFVAEEHLKGPSLLALAIGERCYGVLEKKDGAYVRSRYDDRFVRHMVVSALRASQRQAGLFLLQSDGRTPLLSGMSSSLNLALFQCVYQSDPGEAFFAHLCKKAKKAVPYYYVTSTEIKANRIKKKEKV